MTCIIGIVDNENNNVVIGADSAGVGYDDIVVRKDKKIFKNNGFVIGCTSSFRMIQLLKYSFKPPKIRNKDIFKYMCVDFVNEVRKCFSDGGYLQKWSTGDEKGGIFLIGYKDRLFKIDNDFQVAETVRGYNACGSGESYALGSIYNNKNNNIKNKVLEALKTAEYFSTNVCAPFHIYNT